MSQSAEPPRPTSPPGRFWMRAGLLASVRRHGAGHLGEPHLPDPRLQRGPECRLDGARHALRRRDPERDAAACGHPAAAVARPDPDPRAAGPASTRAPRSGWRPSARRSAPARSSCSTPTGGSSPRATSDRAGSSMATGLSRAPRTTPDGFSMIENADGTRQLPLRPAGDAGRPAARRRRRRRAISAQHEEGWRRARRQGGRDQLRGPGAARLRAELAAADAGEPARRGRASRVQRRCATPASDRRPGLRLRRRHAAPAASRCRSASATGG